MNITCIVYLFIHSRICLSLGISYIYARQFPKKAGYNEDAATGLAACALGSYLSQYEVVRAKADGLHTFEIHQGYAMGRPSVLYSEVMIRNGEITNVRIKGKAEISREELIYHFKTRPAYC